MSQWLFKYFRKTFTSVLCNLEEKYDKSEKGDYEVCIKIKKGGSSIIIIFIIQLKI